MRKPQIQPSLASLTLTEREQLADWLRHGEYDDVLVRVNQPRPDGFGLDISKSPLQTFYAKVALFDLINARQPESKKLSFATFESLARRDIELLTSAENESLAEAHASILNTVADLAKSGGNSTTQLLHLQRLADFPARAELREHKIQMDLARKEFAQQRLEIQKRHLALAEKLAEKKLRAEAAPAKRNEDALGPLAKNWEDVRKRAQKAFGITPEESARRAELRRTWVDPNAHRNTAAPIADPILEARPSSNTDPSLSVSSVPFFSEPSVSVPSENQPAATLEMKPNGSIPETTNPTPPANNRTPAPPLTQDQRLAEFYKGMAAQAAETLKTLNANRATAENETTNHHTL